MRLDKYLADMCIGTRSEVKKIIRAGRVQVDAQTVKDPAYAVTAEMEVVCGGRQLHYQRHEYYMLNKPPGVISASEDPHERTVLDLITIPTRRGLFPVGRLDKDTVGLLLITDDGALAHRLLSPRSHVDKSYLARVSGDVTEAHIQAFAKGLRVDSEFTAMPAELRVLSRASCPTCTAQPDEITPKSCLYSEVAITIREGKFHQIKRMFRAIGMEVLSLKRISMGPLVLDDSLSEGSWRQLTAEEIAALHGFLLQVPIHGLTGRER